MMKEIGKKPEECLWRGNDDVSSECYYSYSPDLPCKKHPLVTFVGICPCCLSDRLLSLVCSDCGEQRLCSCSCSDFSPNRITVLLKEEKTNDETLKQSNETDKVVFFRRSNSSCVEIKRTSHSIWRIGRFWRRIGSKRDEEFRKIGKKSDLWSSEYNDRKKHGVSRSKSLCSYRGNEYFVGSEDGSSCSGARSSISGARCSSVNGGLGFHVTEPRKSSFSETGQRKSSYSETEQRRSCFDGRRRSNFSETEHTKSNCSETERRRSWFEGQKCNFKETEQSRNYFDGRKSNFSETEGRKSNFNETERRRSWFEGQKGNFKETKQRRSNSDGRKLNFIETEDRKSNFSATDGRKSNFSETEYRRSCFEGQNNNFTETNQRRSNSDGRRCNFIETEGRKSNFSETEQRRSNFSKTEQRRSYFDGKRCNFSETEDQKSHFNETEQRRSNFDGRRCNFSETEGRKSNLSETERRRSCLEGQNSNLHKTEHQGKIDAINNPNRRVFFTGGEEPGFIDLKFDYSSSEQNAEFSAIRSMRGFPERNNYGNNCKFQDVNLDHGGGSCGITVDERGIKKSRKRIKGWRWIFRQQPAK